MVSPQRIEKLPAAPTRPDDAHKGTFGSVLIFAGSTGMSGAACLAGYGALRGGAGLVRIATSASIVPIVAAVEPCWTTVALPDDVATACSALQEQVAAHSAVAIGPGLGTHAGTRAIVQATVAACLIPLVIDADGLNAFVGQPQLIRAGGGITPVITPHPGEMSRLTGLSVSEVQADREQVAAEFAATHQVVVLLKGAGTVITDGQRLAINGTGNSGMATGGTGDVLTGLITALLAQGLPPFEAAQLGAHLHGLAGDIAAAGASPISLIASDIHRALPAAWRAHGKNVIGDD